MFASPGLQLRWEFNRVPFPSSEFQLFLRCAGLGLGSVHHGNFQSDVGGGSQTLGFVIADTWPPLLSDDVGIRGQSARLIKDRVRTLCPTVEGSVKNRRAHREYVGVQSGKTT